MYKEWWCEQYEQLCRDQFGCEYYELKNGQRETFDRTVNDKIRDRWADRVDAAKDRAKYED